MPYLVHLRLLPIPERNMWLPPSYHRQGNPVRESPGTQPQPCLSHRAVRSSSLCLWPLPSSIPPKGAQGQQKGKLRLKDTDSTKFPQHAGCMANFIVQPFPSGPALLKSLCYGTPSFWEILEKYPWPGWEGSSGGSKHKNLGFDPQTYIKVGHNSTCL